MLEADLIYLSAITLAVIGETGRRVLTPLLHEAARGGVAVAFDTNYRGQLWGGHAEARAAIEAVITASRYLSASIDDIAGFEPGADAGALARSWADTGIEVVLRHEDGRVEVMNDAGVEHFSALPRIPVVDTTGAGDAFNAAYLSARLRASGVRDAVVAARKLSWVVVQHAGAIIPQQAMPEPALSGRRESADEADG
jgi:2-dehydro-3-deoxygluconokinase